MLPEFGVLATHHLSDLFGDGFWSSQYVALPESKHGPTVTLKIDTIPRISVNVRLDLRHPILRVVPAFELAQAGGEIAPMPEVTVAEHRHASAREHDIGTSVQLPN